MSYQKFGPDALGRIVPMPATTGNVIAMPRRAEYCAPPQPANCRVLEFCPAKPSARRRGSKHELPHKFEKCCPVKKGRAFALAASTTGTVGARRSTRELREGESETANGNS